LPDESKASVSSDEHVEPQQGNWYRIEFLTPDPPRRFAVARQAAPGSKDFVWTGFCFEVDPGDGGEVILQKLQVHSDPEGYPGVEFKAIELDRSGFDNWLKDLQNNGTFAVIWSTGGPGEGVVELEEEEKLEEPAEVDNSDDAKTRAQEALEYSLRFIKALEEGGEIPPLRPTIWGTSLNAKPKAPPEPETRPESRLAKCEQCGYVFIKSLIQGAPVQCEQCGGSVAWQLRVPAVSGSTAASPKLCVDQLSYFTGQSFERFLKILFENMGYSVEITPVTTDQGADLILTDQSGQKIAVQAKRYNQDVGNAAVQETLGGIAYWGCHSGIVVSASGFTRAARDLASKAPAVILWDKPVLEVLIDRYMSDVTVFVAEKQAPSQSV